MTIEKDSALQAWFDSAPQAAPNEAVVANIARQIDGQRRRTMLGWAVAGIALLPVAWWLSGAFATLFRLIVRLMPDSLVNIETAWLDQVLAPINSLAGVAGLVFLFAWWLFRKLRA
jgi:hypothetical protein